MTISRTIAIIFIQNFCIALFSCNSSTSKEKVIKENTKIDSVQVVNEKPAPPLVAHDFTLIATKGNDSIMNQLKNMSAEEKKIIAHLNRIDFSRIRNLDSIIIPSNIDKNLLSYSPFPLEFPLIKDVNKIVYFSYPTQTYGVYENGKLIKWGATSMGKKATKTPTGLFFTNWKGRKVTSTVNSSWILQYNFNVSNKGGVGWHQYDMPGYPASHSCMRLFMDDAQWLYEYADQWKLENDQVIAKGTPVIIYGDYPWGQRKPWRNIIEDKNAMHISTETLTSETQPHLEKILIEQQNAISIATKEPQPANDTVSSTAP